MYYLGNGKNPIDMGAVEVTCSSLQYDSEPVKKLLDREIIRVVTKADPYQNLVIKLVGKKAKMSKYSLRHYSSWDTEALRSWKIEGTNDNSCWTLISKHTQDMTLKTKGGTGTWTVNTDEFYSTFRLTMTGMNSNNHWYLALSGFEMYGDLIICDDKHMDDLESNFFTNDIDSSCVNDVGNLIEPTNNKIFNVEDVPNTIKFTQNKKTMNY
eukprot:UN23519